MRAGLCGDGRSEMSHPPETTDEIQGGAFPTATIVVGIGKMGDRILHQLGERWSWIATDNPHDQTLSHLSLMHLDASSLKGEAWARAEAFEAYLAREEGDASGPDRALDLLVLRTLGLIRFIDGEYQIASPVDEGSLSLLADAFPATISEELTPQNGQPNGSSHADEQSKKHDLELSDVGYARLLDALSLYTDAAHRGEREEAKAGAPAVEVAEPAQAEEAEALSGKNEQGAQRLGDRRPHRGAHREGLFARHTTFRRRSYRWVRLAEDPLDAADALAELVQTSGSLARFIEPILARVRDGNSPKILLSLLRRLKSWQAGRDPSPWRWLASSKLDRAGSDGERHDPLHGLLRAYAEALFERSEGSFEAPAHRHDHFHADDPHNVAPLDPWLLLSLDWETPGWTFPANGLDQRVFRTLPAHPRDFGFYDRDAREEKVDLTIDLDKVYAHLGARQEKLARLARRGLLRLWAQLTRIRLGARSDEDAEGEFNEIRLEALHQSLAILGELLVREIAEGTAQAAEEFTPRAADGEERASYRERHRASVGEVEQLNDTWCAAIRRRDRTNLTRLVDRLDRLGIQVEDAEEEPFQLYHRIGLKLEDQPQGEQSHPEDPAESGKAIRLSEATEHKVRHLINKRVRSLLSAGQLSKLPRPPGQMPLYIRVFIVGDMGEKVTRLFSQPVLRIIHAELLRVVRPIYDGRFDGHTRPLAVVPFFSMPHPADSGRDEYGESTKEPRRGERSSADKPAEPQPGSLPSGERVRTRSGLDEESAEHLAGYESERRRITERLVIDAIHHVRRSIELIPPAERLTFELLVSGRVTDRSVMSIDDSIDEIRSFIWMNARNSLADDAELTTLLSNRGGDLLSTVSCRELSFPVERARAWAANRFERTLLHVFKMPPPDSAAARSPEKSSVFEKELKLQASLKGPAEPADKLPPALEGPFEKITRACEELRDSVRDSIDLNLDIGITDDASVFLNDKASEADINALIYRPINETWARLAEQSRGVDEEIAKLRQDLAKRATTARQKINQRTEEIIANECARKGSLHALAQVNEMEGDASDYLREAEKSAAWAEDAVASHPRPSPENSIKKAVDDFRDAVRAKPDFAPFIFFGVSTAFALALILGPRLIAYIGQMPIPGIGRFLSVQHPGWLMSRSMEMFVGGALLLLGGLLLYFVMRRSIRRIDDARVGLQEAVAQAIGVPPNARASSEASDQGRLALFTKRRRRSEQDGATATEPAKGTVSSKERNDSLLPFFTKRLRHRWELARKTHALYVWESTVHDATLAQRLRLAAEVRIEALRLAAEKLGVKAHRAEGGYDRDQIDKLFDTELGADAQWLVGTRSLERWYRDETKSSYGGSIEEDTELARDQLIEYFERNPLRDWRRAVPFGDDALEAYCREHWSALVDEAVISLQPLFRDAAGASLREFVSSHFGTLGFGAQFRGYEGMDDDGIDARELLLVLPSTLRHEFEDALEENGAKRGDDSETTRRKRIIRQIPKSFTDIRPNAAYLLMTAMGIRERSFQNLRRFVSFHDRRGLIERERFPLSPKGLGSASSADRPLNPFLYTSLSDANERAPSESESER